MKAIIFSGALERRENSTSTKISTRLCEQLKLIGFETIVFKIADSGIPLFDITLTKTPKAVELMNIQFREADIHIWLTPLYHGSMTGVMKNCLDWLEISAKKKPAYLTGKMIGFVCWADGVQAMQGINAMDSVAKALRAWTSPFSVPIQIGQLFTPDGEITKYYEERFDLLLQILTKNKITLSNEI